MQSRVMLKVISDIEWALTLFVLGSSTGIAIEQDVSCRWAELESFGCIFGAGMSCRYDKGLAYPIFCAHM